MSAPTVTTGQIVNVREGPGTAYAVLGQITPGNTYTVLSKNEAGDWWKIDTGSGRRLGHQPIGRCHRLDRQLSPSPPTFRSRLLPLRLHRRKRPAAVRPRAGPAPAAAPVVSAPPPSGGIPFGYGVQAHMVHTSDDMINQVMGSTKGMGFNWVKQQIEWSVFEGSPGAIDFGSADPIINAANAAGVNVLFSVVNAPAWARERGFDGSVGGPPQDPQTYANFVGALAGNYCGSSLKMIEVWNEQNLHYEWGNKPLNPGEYVAAAGACLCRHQGSLPVHVGGQRRADAGRQQRQPGHG